jgi:hypothetical protein
MNTLAMTSDVIEQENIFDLLNINYKNIDRALRILKRSNSGNDEVRVLFKQNEEKVKVFDLVEIVKNNTQESTKVVLKRSPSKTTLYRLKILIDKLYRLYGEDVLIRKNFFLNDLIDIHNGFVVEREWVGSDFEYPLCLRYSKALGLEMEISLR